MTRILISLTVAFTAVPDTTAQDAPGRLTVMQSGANELLRDLEHILKLTDGEEQKQWKVIKEYFDEVFLMGVDPTKPIRMDLIFEPGAYRYLPSFPVKKNIGEFRRNLDSFNVMNRRIRVKGAPKGRLYYRLSNDFEGYMMAMALDADTRYASIAEKKTDLPFKFEDPRNDLKLLLDRKYDAAIELVNPPDNPGGDVQLRRDAFMHFREDKLKNMKKLEEETEEDFEIRTLFTKHQMDEAERFYAESAHAVLGWKGLFGKDETKNGRIELELSALEGTELDEGIRELATTPSRFANVPKSEKPILSGRLQFPLDELRQTNFLEMATLLRSRAEKEIDASENRTDEQKAAGKQISALVFEIIQQGIKTGMLDGFIEAHANESGHKTLVGGVRAADGEAARAVLELLPQTKAGRTVEMDADEKGDVKIHKVTFAEGDLDDYKAFFGDDLTVFVGTSPDTMWLAGGENALSELKTAIEQASTPGEPSADGTFADLYAQIGPWIELWSKRRGDKGHVKIRQFALDAFKLGEDVLTVNLRQSDGKVTGEMVVQPGILRFAGKLIADFSKENLE